MNIGVPLSSNVIPAGTGLVQSVECKGVKLLDRKQQDAFELPVIAQISTFSNGIRRVCCQQAKHFSGLEGEVTKCGRILGSDCIYAWKDPA